MNELVPVCVNFSGISIPQFGPYLLDYFIHVSAVFDIGGKSGLIIRPDRIVVYHDPDVRFDRDAAVIAAGKQIFNNPAYVRQSSILSLISSELPLSSGAYMAEIFVGRALNLPGISARMRYETLCLPRASHRTKNATRSSRSSI